MIIKIVCKNCGRPFEYLKRFKNYSKYLRKFCTRCKYVNHGVKKANSGSFKKGDQHRNWRGGKIKTDKGYILIYTPNHPYGKRRGQYVLQHRLVAEKHLGRYLKPKEIIHHINDIKTDNRTKNLYLFKSRGYHMLFHRKVNKGILTLSSLVSNLI